MKRLTFLLLAGCAHGLHFDGGPAPALGPERPPRPFSVGVAKADITPPPSAATFGHGPDARLAMGYWTRLECRAFFFSTGPLPEDQLVIVPCDLAAMSHLLQRTVAAKVKDLAPTSRVMLTATHTHAGPAHYFESRAYGGATSTRWPGFDPEMVEFLASRIARAITEAHANLAPARLRWVHGEAWGLSRNRSLEAWRLNPVPWRAPTADPLAPMDEQAIDPAVDVLQLARASDDAALGWLVFFAVHPTVLPATNRLFNGDVLGVAARALEAQVDAPVAFVNTNEGDVSPVYERPTPAEVLRVGHRLGEVVHAIVHDAPPNGFVDQANIDARWLELDLDRVLLEGEPLCHAELGQGALRGASDHRSSIEHLSQDAADTDALGACAPRRKGLGLIQDFIAGPSGFPTRAPLALVRLGEVLLSFVPAELTVTAGHQLDEVVAHTGPASARALVVGLANGYFQYVTTPSEFDLQAYEGASTLYGRRTLALLLKHYETLARSLRGEDVGARLGGPGEGRIDEVREVDFKVATNRTRLARADYNAPDLEGQRGLLTFCRLRGSTPEPARLCAVWKDDGPGRIWADVNDSLQLVRPWVSLREGSTTVFDDTGTGVMVRTHGPQCDGDDRLWRWTALLSPSHAEWAALTGKRLRFDVTGALRPSLQSAEFDTAALPEECDLRTTRQCLTEAPIDCH